MAWLFRRVGSDPFYASYERSLERLTKECSRLQAHKASRKRSKDDFGTVITVIGVVLFLAALVHAHLVAKYPPGSYSLREYLLHVLPVVLVPMVTIACMRLSHALARFQDGRDDRRLEALESKVKSMISELKDSTRFDKTQQLLRKFDPEYRPPPTPAMQQQALIAAGRAGPRLQSPLPLRWAAEAGSRVLPLLDNIANTFIGSDDPVLLQGLREARREAALVKEGLAMSQARCAALEAENRELRRTLGLPVPEEEQAASPRPDLAAAASANFGLEAGGGAGVVQPGAAAPLSLTASGEEGQPPSTPAS